MRMAGNKSTGIRIRLVTPTTQVIRQSTIIRYGYRSAKRDITRMSSLWRIFFDGCPEFFDGKIRRLAQFDERLLLRGDFRRHWWDLGRYLLGDRLDPVLIAVQ